ncbi:sortase [Brevibacillus borstelensis]|uniref:class D sortase n=1 Tax=Brevibacillus borstelensis TaxID=45462 RepID=UPI0030C4A462
MKMRLFSVLLMLAGIVVLSYPTLAEEYQDYQQQKLVREWQNSLRNISNGEEASGSIQTTVPPVAEASQSGEEANGSAGNGEKTAPDFSSYQNMEGILTIEKIDLMLPILHGASDKNMKTTVASIENTGKPGEVGNYAIAGHRNFTYGRNFNRLDEMTVGDKIEVDNGQAAFAYTVTEKLYVKPEEVWVLEGNREDKEITLITCHPMHNPTHRLIIKGKIAE